MNIRIAVYLRVSTQEQSVELQRSELLKYCDARNWTITNIYEEKISGTNANRPQLKQLMEAARQRQFDVVLVWKLDRFFRSLKDLVGTLHELAELGVEFVSLKDMIDMTTASGKLLTHLLGAFGEFEASLIRERVKAGLEHAKRKGTKLGRPRRIQEDLVRKLRGQGYSLNQIAKQIGASKAGVYKTLCKMPVTNPVTKPEIIGTKNHG